MVKKEMQRFQTFLTKNDLKQKIKSVLGKQLDFGKCFDLLESYYNQISMFFG
jgi:hypothetical protein